MGLIPTVAALEPKRSIIVLFCFILHRTANDLMDPNDSHYKLFTSTYKGFQGNSLPTVKVPLFDINEKVPEVPAFSDTCPSAQGMQSKQQMGCP